MNLAIKQMARPKVKNHWCVYSSLDNTPVAHEGKYLMYNWWFRAFSKSHALGRKNYYVLQVL